MALDTYVCCQRESDIIVTRYKSQELMESMKVPLSGQVAASVEKRRAIVKKWLENNKPLDVIYYFDQNEIEEVKI
jgi:hypothetical protein